MAIEAFNSTNLDGLTRDFGTAQARVSFSMDLNGVTGPMAGFGNKTSIASTPSAGATYDALQM